VAYTDALADAGSGWLADDALPRDPIAAFDVQWDDTAAEQAAWIEVRTQLPLRERATATLALGPEPHPYRRIRRDGDDLVLAVKEWRVRFSVADRLVRVRDVTSGNTRGEQLAAHREFRERWPH
jgi:hypothetical protein